MEYIFDSYSGILCDKVFLNVDGNEYWYENGVRQGTEGRGKEIYDPATDGWYWLDAVDGGKRAVSKDVFQESDGGKWVRYDENGKMVKGWNATVDKGKLTFVIDPNTGASHWDYESYEGDGDIYYFDPVTGAMARVRLSLTVKPMYLMRQPVCWMSAALKRPEDYPASKPIQRQRQKSTTVLTRWTRQPITHW